MTGTPSLPDAQVGRCVSSADQDLRYKRPARLARPVRLDTEYELAAADIAAALPGTTLFGSAAAVAAQTLRRAGADGSGTPPPGAPRGTGTVRVLLSGRRADLPAAALRYPEGRLLAGLVADRRPGDGAGPAARARSVPA